MLLHAIVSDKINKAIASFLLILYSLVTMMPSFKRCETLYDGFVISWNFLYNCYYTFILILVAINMIGNYILIDKLRVLNPLDARPTICGTWIILGIY